MKNKEYPLNKKYIVYEDGRIFSKRFGKFLTPKINWDGYHRIQIWENGKCSMISWHRVIAETFLEKPDGCDIVNHKNGIKSDNRVENLEWVTQKDNVIHAWKNGLSKSQINNSKLSKKVDQLTLDGEFIKTFDSQMDVERQLNIPHGNISNACKFGRTAKGFKWRYSENL